MAKLNPSTAEAHPKAKAKIVECPYWNDTLIIADRKVHTLHMMPSLCIDVELAW